MSRPRLIAYRRVSTARQGASGLGLEAQDQGHAQNGVKICCKGRQTNKENAAKSL